MGGWISIVKLGKGASKVKIPKVRFGGLSSSLSSLGSRFSAWIQGTKFSSWLKAGVAGGVGYTIYHGWKSGIDSIANATGISSGTVESLLFAFFGIMVAYVAAKLLFPDSGKTTVVVGDSKSRSRSGSRSASRSGSVSKDSPAKKKPVRKSAKKPAVKASSGSAVKSKGGRR